MADNTTLIGSLFTPAIWSPTIQEKLATFPSLYASPIVFGNDRLDEIATGGGITSNIPLFHDITDQPDEIQTDNTAPTNTQGITTVTQITATLRRVTKTAASALSGAVSGADPVSAILTQLAVRRAKQRNSTILALLRGAFGTAAGATGGLASAAPLAAVRQVIATEDGNAATSANQMGVTAFTQAKALMGELGDGLLNGGIFIHPNVQAVLEQLDAVSFKTVEPGLASGLPYKINTYRGMRIFLSSALVRAGTTSGFVYETYLLAPGIFAEGKKPQTGDQLDSSSLQYFLDRDKNAWAIWDRTQFILHLNGMKWTGTAAGQSPTNVELATFGNWALTYLTANRVGAVCIVSN